MVSRNKFIYTLVCSSILLITFPFTAIAQTGRTEINLSGLNWSLWLDTAAKWQNDQLYAPPVNLKTLPVNPQPADGGR